MANGGKRGVRGLSDDDFDLLSVRDCQGSVRSPDIVPNFTQCTPDAAFCQVLSRVLHVCSAWLRRSELECCIVWMPSRGPHARRLIFC